MPLQRTWWEGQPFTWPETQQGTITPANTNFQLMRIPYPNPSNAKTTLLAIYLSNSSVTAAVVTIWDQDLTDSSTAAGNRGSTSAPILRVNVPASGDVSIDVLTRPYFQTGIAAQSTQNNMFYSIYTAHAGLGT
jgi:hypothetical protein